jgi:MFS family permease
MALVFQIAGVLMMVLARDVTAGGATIGAFWMLFVGSALTALGSGAIEAACNPLIATIYPDKKTHKLNQFHMWFPGGIVLGGLACYGLDWAGMGYWQLKLAIVLAPMVVYGLLFTGQYFPPTERVASGVSFWGMFKATLFRPLFIVLLLTMMLTGSLELGPNRWIPAVLQAGGIPGILVLVWITGLMAVLRLAAGPVVRWFGNSGLLLVSAVLGGIGLFALSFGGNIVVVGVAATVFAFGVCYFWPTMLGTVAERVPAGGAFALGVIGGLGGLFVGFVTTPVIGWVADHYLHQELVAKTVVDGKTVDRQAQTLAALRDVKAAYEKWGESLGDTAGDRVLKADIGAALIDVSKVLSEYDKSGELPKTLTAQALRIADRNGPGGDEKTKRTETRAAGILNPADNKGGLMAFRWVSPISIVLVVVFGVMFVQDRRKRRAEAARSEAAGKS